MIPEFQITKSRKSGRKITSLILFLLVLGLIGFSMLAYVKINRPISSEDEPVTFSVPKGASTREVGVGLESKNLVSNSYLFLAYATFNGANGKIQAGDYALNKNMDMKEILDTMTSGKVTRNEKRVTIVEGWTNKQLSAELIKQGFATEGQMKEALKKDYDFKFNPDARDYQYEGYLFPDTYHFNANLSTQDIVQRMLKNFEGKITDEMLAEMNKRKLSMHDVIVMASIIEREVGRASSVSITPAVREEMQRERELVSSVFYNRLEIGMPLQSDATVNYVTGKNDRQARFEDLEVSSPYNTYKVKGLPPGPISNPGIESIRAAIFPADSNYLYFLSDAKGKAYFGRTIEEHNANRAKYLD